MSSLVHLGENVVRVDVRDLAPGESASVEFQEAVALQSDDQTVEAPAAGTLRLQRNPHGATVRGRVRAQVPLVCSRCLLPFREAITVDVEEAFSLDPVGHAAGGELEAEDFVAWVGPGREIDLTEIVRQHLQLSVPMAPLHAEECRGLCPVCGANWNERVCEHFRAQG